MTKFGLMLAAWLAVCGIIIIVYGLFEGLPAIIVWIALGFEAASMTLIAITKQLGRRRS